MPDRLGLTEIHRRPPRYVGDDGEFLGTVILFMSFMGLFFVCFYAAVYYHAYSVVNAAAQDSLRAAQLYGNDLDDGYAAAENIVSLAQLSQVAIEVEQNNFVIDTRVSGRVSSPVFGWSATVLGEARGPKERYIATTEDRPGYVGP